MVNQSKWDVLPLILLTLFPPINIDIYIRPFLLASEKGIRNCKWNNAQFSIDVARDQSAWTLNLERPWEWNLMWECHSKRIWNGVDLVS